MVFGIGDSINEDDDNYEFIEFQNIIKELFIKQVMIMLNG